MSGTSSLDFSTSAVQCAGTDTFEILNDEVFSLWLGSVLLVNCGKKNVNFELSFRDGLFRNRFFFGTDRDVQQRRKMKSNVSFRKLPVGAQFTHRQHAWRHRGGRSMVWVLRDDAPSGVLLDL